MSFESGGGGLESHGVISMNSRQTVRRTLLLWQAPLGVLGTKHSHQSPEWTILSHNDCFIQGEVIGFQVLLGSMRAS